MAEFVSRKTRIIYRFISPSIISVPVTVALAVFILFAGSSSFLSETNFIYKAVLGTEASPTLINSLTEKFDEFGEIFANDQLGALTVFLFWMLVGVCVYGIFSYAGNVFTELSGDVKKLRFTKQEKRRFGPFTVALEHFAFRTGLFTIAVVYTWFLANFIFPATFASFRAGLIEGMSLSGIGYFISSVALASISMHFYVVLTRLYLLRYRLIG